jgi:hypothetical protein
MIPLVTLPRIIGLKSAPGGKINQGILSTPGKPVHVKELSAALCKTATSAFDHFRIAD